MRNGIIYRGFEVNDIRVDLNELINYCKVRFVGLNTRSNFCTKLIGYGIYWDFDRSIHQETFEE